ncbi:lytic transglycosylase domain-containing protein, partial [Modestobacter roseus]
MAGPVQSSPLAAGGIPAAALGAYTRAAQAAPPSCGIRWELLAGIGLVESNHGRFAGAVLQPDGTSSPRIVGIPLTGSGATAEIRDTDQGRLDGDASYDRAVGPMQFIPSTWARYAADGDGDGRTDPFDLDDAAAAAARYLCAAGGDLSNLAGQARAVYAYNHSTEYVTSVLLLAASYAGTPVTPTAPAPAVRVPAPEPVPAPLPVPAPAGPPPPPPVL